MFCKLNFIIFCSLPLALGALQRTSVFKVEGSWVKSVTVLGIDINRNTIEACSNFNCYILQAPAQDVRIIKFGSSDDIRVGLVTTWSAVPLDETNSDLTLITHVYAIRSTAVAVCYQDTCTHLHVLKWGSAGISALGTMPIAEQESHQNKTCGGRIQ